MADNVTLDPGSGGAVIATDELAGGVQAPVSKILLGDDGANGGFVHSGNPLPAAIANGGDVTQGAKADAVAGSDLTAALSIVSLMKAAVEKLRGTLNTSDATAQTTLTAIAASVDGLEAALAGTLNVADATARTTLAAIDGHVDGLEAALGTTTDAAAAGNGSLIAITKQLRTLLGGTLAVGDATAQGLLTTLVAQTDGLESLLAGTLAVSVASLPLPSGAATSARQDTGNTSLGNLDTKLGEVQGSPTANTVLDRLKTGNTSLASLETKIGEVQASPTANTVLDRLKAIATGITGLLSGIVLAAGTNLIGKVIGALRTDALYNDTTALTPKFAKIDVASSGNNTLVAAVTSKKIRVIRYTLKAAGAVNVKFQSGAGGTDLSGAMPLAGAGDGVTGAEALLGHLETASGALLNLNLSAGVQVSGHLTYVEV